jgi:hypothetical protein
VLAVARVPAVVQAPVELARVVARAQVRAAPGPALALAVVRGQERVQQAQEPARVRQEELVPARPVERARVRPAERVRLAVVAPREPEPVERQVRVLGPDRVLGRDLAGVPDRGLGLDLVVAVQERRAPERLVPRARPGRVPVLGQLVAQRAVLVPRGQQGEAQERRAEALAGPAGRPVAACPRGRRVVPRPCRPV